MSKPKIPVGFKPINWASLQVHTVVYILGTANEKPTAYGPFTVTDTDTCTLRNADGVLFSHRNSDLLLREGPCVYITINEGEFCGVYANVPLDVYVSKHSMLPMPTYELELLRPKQPDSIPEEHRKYILNELFSSFSEPWVLNRVNEAPKQDANKLTTIHFDNKLAAMTLMNWLVHNRLWFTSVSKDYNYEIIVRASDMYEITRQLSGTELIK